MLLAFRLALVGLSIAVTVWLVLRPGYYSVTILSAASLLMFSAELWWFISRTNREIARFLDAA